MMHVADRLGDGKVSTTRLDASESMQNWNAAKKSLTWADSARVLAPPWARETPPDESRVRKLHLTVR